MKDDENENKQGSIFMGGGYTSFTLQRGVKIFQKCPMPSAPSSPLNVSFSPPLD
jgi:hypothetical protein